MLACSLDLPAIVREMISDTLKSGEAITIRGTGMSMEPTICSGDLLTVAAFDTLQVGDIVLLHVAPHLMVVHRVIEISERNGKLFVTTKGDNLSKPDTSVPIDCVIGRVIKIS
jgi:signal peptidase I